MDSLPQFSVVPAARLDGPDGLDAALAHGDALAVQVHRRAAVGRDHLAAVADRAGAVACIRPCVCSSDSRVSFSSGWPLMTGMPKSFEIALLPASSTYQPRATADDRGQDRQRAAELRPHRVVGAVHEQERAGLDLGHAREPATNSQVPVPPR